MLTTREMMKLTLVSALAFGFGRGRAWSETPQSPPTRPFVVELFVPPVAEPVTSLNPAPPVGPFPFQRYHEFSPQKLYEIHATEALHSFHPDLPLNRIWGYDGMHPGPTFHAKYGEPILVRFHNELPTEEEHVGFGKPQISTHLHNAHTPSESDGFPDDFFPKKPEWTELGDTPWLLAYKDNHYPNVLAGFSDPRYAPVGDLREALGTLWYHDHRRDFTSQNVYKGLAGFYLLFDEYDSGNELDPNPKAFRLPSGEYDVPMLFADKVFDSKGQLFFDQFNLDGILGDKFCVNGKIQPYFKVARRKYRFRWLDGGPSRFYEFCLRKGQWDETSGQIRNLGTLESFIQIANDGNLLPMPVGVQSVRLGVAERADVIVDFSKYQVGDQIFLFNRLEQENGRGPTGQILDPGAPILRFDVSREAPDPSRVPEKLRDLPEIDLSKATQRTWVFNRSNGAWQINGQFYDSKPRATPKQGSAEVWTLKNGGGGWSHPIHIHFEEFRILQRNGRPILFGSPEYGRKDVVVLNPGEEVQIFIRFRDFPDPSVPNPNRGRYIMHCHNTVHEDHAMMVRWDIVP